MSFISCTYCTSNSSLSFTGTNKSRQTIWSFGSNEKKKGGELDVVKMHLHQKCCCFYYQLVKFVWRVWQGHGGRNVEIRSPGKNRRGALQLYVKCKVKCTFYSVMCFILKKMNAQTVCWVSMYHQSMPLKTWIMRHLYGFGWTRIPKDCRGLASVPPWMLSCLSTLLLSLLLSCLFSTLLSNRC